MKKKKVAIIIVIAIAVCIGGYAGYKYYAKTQQEKISTELSDIVNNIQGYKSAFNTNSLLNNSDVSSEVTDLQNTINADITEIESLQKNQFNNAELSSKETEIYNMLSYMRAYSDVLSQYISLYNETENIGALPSEAQVNNIINKCNDILNSSAIQTLTIDENDYGTSIENLLDVSSLMNVQELTSDLNNTISNCQSILNDYNLL